jgi:hypothetical protein
MDIAKIPVANLRVPREEFAALWTAAEQRVREQAARGLQDWHAAGVVVTCRWLARATVRPADGEWYVAFAPVTQRTRSAQPELIEAEQLAAEKLDMLRPRPGWLQRRPGWSEAICATFRWAWARTGPAPLQVDELSTAN